MRVMTGGVKGPRISASSPTAWKMTATVLRESPTAAATGSTIGAMMAFPPAMVPRRPTIVRQASMMPSIAFFCVSTPMVKTIRCTMVWETRVALSTSPRPRPSMMISPTSARNDPMPPARAAAKERSVWWLRSPPRTTQIAVAGSMSTLRNTRTTYTASGASPNSPR